MLGRYLLSNNLLKFNVWWSILEPNRMTSLFSSFIWKQKNIRNLNSILYTLVKIFFVFNLFIRSKSAIALIVNNLPDTWTRRSSYLLVQPTFLLTTAKDLQKGIFTNYPVYRWWVFWSCGTLLPSRSPELLINLSDKLLGDNYLPQVGFQEHATYTLPGEPKDPILQYFYMSFFLTALNLMFFDTQ